MIHSIAGALAGGALTDRRPFRAPHHSASMAALVGGGPHAKPGEISLAHNGVLFLDELPEFHPQALDSLRQPIETGEVAISRASHRVVYPARFQLVAAMNPCRCGLANEPGYACNRAPNPRCVAQYLGRLSGPLIDRFDLLIDVPSVGAADLIAPAPAEGSAEAAARVAAARQIQLERCQELGLKGVSCNAAIPAGLIEDIVEAEPPALGLLRDAAERLRLSARGYHRVLKLARTLADLDGGGATRRVHIAEALSYRGAPDRTAVAA
jgi:magnesium chelatase family protein